MTTIERRAEIIKLADALNAHRIALAATINEINKATALLVNAADALLPAAVTERVGAPSTGQLQHIAGPKRTCGLCHEPGHRRANCPKAHEVKRRPKRHISPERRAQLAEQLSRARAKRAALKEAA